MANIEFGVFSKKEPMNLNIRFYHNKIDINTKTNIFIFEKDFRFKRISKGKKSARYVDIINESIKEKTDKLKRNVYDKFAEDFPKGNSIDSAWLIRIINEFHERPEGENDSRYYIYPFAEQFIKEMQNKINPKTGKKLDLKTITRHKYTLSLIKDYEEYSKQKVRIMNVDLNFHNDFVNFLKDVHNYGNTTIEKQLSTIKQYVREASQKGYKISPEIESSSFTIKKDEVIDTYLNETEIDLIYNYDLSDNKRLDNVRDLFITGLWTGLRISDLKRINSFDMSHNRIKISETEKTDTFVEIPIHSQLRQILEKREGVLPEISDQRFNEYVKELCELVGINEVILGGLRNPETNRKEKGNYPKFKLISSHTCRRSFVSNHYGKLDDKTIMAITGHKSHSQFLDYVKTSKREHADKLEKYWEEQEKEKQEMVDRRMKIAFGDKKK
ncbi:phage integrase SAM-like domain-containing protein [Elizabethkingia anophelis]|uniref:phage integrase SAM-like domain-containing protein n=1 Tax=Elizabethkingia anophelis TaxID=1117645 RepID=UPI0020B7C8B9|nr:phage integrase SAM-like domain-containing protein [Elizabethkingia anophelis]MCT3699011.1 phage integrase SAM-like domain-containing protein [Elizabethkingia anophelis]MCT4264835.1 phage integrase SAM-like domain-containing protein [Elizabethkingia anophelis]MCT4268844.1 phage integrase SAM-like domain-containing protein [Elizabethkingia anophelis]MDV3498914.1 integrase [Elizabethkingia anophelis]MDV3931844.1 integrase [Elizabethkingia anophelis]